LKFLIFVLILDGNILPSRFDTKEDYYAKEINIKDKGSLTQTINDKGKHDLSFYFKYEVKYNKSFDFLESRNMQLLSDVKNDCLYRWKSEALNSCLVVKERNSTRNGSIITTNLPNYYLSHLSCQNVTEDKLWTKRDERICSNKNEMCLTVSYGETDGRAFVTLTAYNASMFQRWKTRANGKKRTVAVINVETTLCLFNSKDGTKKTIAVNQCDPSNLKTENLFYFEQAILKNRKNCPPLKNVEESKNKKLNKKL